MGISEGYVVEHSKNYLVSMQVFGDMTFEEPAELNFLTTSFEIIYSGGSNFVNQKGRNIASAFAMQPSVSINFSCYMTNPDFAVLTSIIIAEQQQVLLSIGRIKANWIKTKSIFSPSSIIPSVTIHEAVGFLRDAKITASVGEFIKVDFTLNADDIRDIRPEKLPEFNP